MLIFKLGIKNFYFFVSNFIILLVAIFLFIFYFYGVGESQIFLEKDKEGIHFEEEGGIHLSEEAKLNIGLTVEQVGLRTIEKVIRINGIVRAHPDRNAYVTSRIDGKVERIYVNIGDEVKVGQKLVEIESRRYGNPPPIVEILSPLSGRVVERNVILGDSIDPAKRLFHIIDLSVVWVEGDVLEDYISLISEGQKVRIRLEAYPEEIFTGELKLIGDILDSEKRSVHIWVEIKNPALKLKPGMFAQMSIVVGEQGETLAVPKEAVLGDEAEKFVFVEKGGSYFKRNIVVGIKDDRYIQVVEGLNLGELVVTRGNHQLRSVRVGVEPAAEAGHH